MTPLQVEVLRTFLVEQTLSMGDRRLDSVLSHIARTSPLDVAALTSFWFARALTVWIESDDTGRQYFDWFADAPVTDLVGEAFLADE